MSSGPNDHKRPNGPAAMGENERILPGISKPEAREMSLEGAEALTLYLKELGRNMEALGETFAMLQKALIDRKDLLQEIQPGKPGPAESSRDAKGSPDLQARCGKSGAEPQ